MSCIVRPGIVIKYVSYDMEVYYYVLDDVATDGNVWSKCVSSVGDLLTKAGYFVVDTKLDDWYESVTTTIIKDWYPKEGNLCLYRDTRGDWKVLKYTKFSVGYCFESLIDGAKYNLPGGTFVCPLTGLTESMVTEGSGSKGGYDDLAEEYHNLLEEYAKLGDDYEALYDSHDELVSDYQVLGEQKDELEKKVDLLKKENEELKALNGMKAVTIDEYDALTEEHHALQGEYDRLAEECDFLSSRYDELSEAHSELVSDYDVLREQKAELEKEVDSLKKENEKLKTMNEVKTEAIENYIHPDNCKHWDGGSCTCGTENVKPYKEEIARLKNLVIKPYKEEIERLKNLVIKLTEELMERR